MASPSAAAAAAPAADASAAEAVTVAAYLPSGAKRTVRVDADASLWAVLGQLDAEHAEKLRSTTSPTGEFLQPVVVVQRAEFGAVKQLTATSLRSLGVTRGNLAIRIGLRPSGRALADVEAELAQIERDRAEQQQQQQQQQQGDSTGANKKSRFADDASAARVHKLLDKLREECGAASEALGHALATLLTVATNLARAPDEPKFRTLLPHGPKLHQRIGRFAAALELLRALGFAPSQAGAEGAGEGGEAWTLAADGENRELVAEAVRALEAAAEVHAQQRKQIEADERAARTADPAHVFSHVDPEEEKKRLEQRQHAGAAPARSMFDHVVGERGAEVDEEERRRRAAAEAPDYDLDQIRATLRRDTMFAGATDEEYRAALSALVTVARNLGASPARPEYRDLNTAHPGFASKLGRWPGARAFLEFLGFAAAADGHLRMDPRREHTRRTDAALGIARRFLAEASVEPVNTAPIPREMVVLHADRSALGNANEFSQRLRAEEDSRDDALLLKAWASSERRFREEPRFVNRRKAEEERERNRPQFAKTVLQVMFKDEATILQGCFNPNEPLRALLDFVRAALRDAALKFVLRVPPRDVYDETTEGSFRDLGLQPAATVHFALADGAPHRGVLRPEVVAQRQQFAPQKVPSPINREAEEGDAKGAHKASAAAAAAKAPAAPPMDDEAELERRAALLLQGGGLGKAPRGAPAPPAGRPGGRGAGGARNPLARKQ